MALFWQLCFIFTCLKYFIIILFEIFIDQLFFSTISFSLQMFVLFPFSSCNWFLISYYHSRRNAWYYFYPLKFVIFCTLACDLYWRIFCKHLKKMSILLFLDGMSYRYKVQLRLWWHLRPLLPYWFSIWMICPLM